MVVEGYGEREQASGDHLWLVAECREWKSAPAGSGTMTGLERFLLDRAMERDSPALLFSLAPGS